ncbi:MAG: TRAP transporter permease, partial [Oscillospiraceae bacterium]|nr:TRAP transporter permease [Oscillospiraceae bacterium]
AIAKAPPMKTAVNATKLAIAAVVVPYIFAMNPAMLFVNTTALQVVLVVLTSLIGIFGVASALNGYLLCPINPVIRILFAAGGLLILDPSLTTDLIGLVVFAAALVWQILASRRRSAAVV